MKYVVIMTIGILMVFGPLANATSIEDIYSEKNNYWYVGSNLFEGDKYSYNICDYELEKIHMDPCYAIDLEFIAYVDTPTGTELITQGVIISENNHSFVMQISDNFKVRTDALSDPYGKSLERTIFDLKKFASESFPKYLNTNAIWGNVESYYGDKKDVEVRNYDETKEIAGITGIYELGYFVKEISTIEINKDLAFPIKAEVFSTTHIFPDVKKSYEYEIKQFTAYENTNSCNIDFESTTTIQESPIDEIKTFTAPIEITNETNTILEPSYETKQNSTMIYSSDQIKDIIENFFEVEK